MINKQNMWFVTLFSIILVLSIYYVTISDNTLQEIIDKSEQPVSQEVSVEESDIEGNRNIRQVQCRQW